MKMICRAILVASCAGAFISAPVPAAIGTGPQTIPELLNASTTVVVGRAIQAEAKQGLGGYDEVVVIAVDRIIKGSPAIDEGKLRVATHFSPALGSVPVSPKEYGIFFLQPDSSGVLTIVNPMEPLLPALPWNRPLSSTEDPYQQIAEEFANVLAASPETLIDSVLGMGSQIVANSADTKADLIYSLTAWEFKSIPAAVGDKTLRTIADANRSVHTRLWVTDVLLSFGDESNLSSVKGLLLDPPANTASDIRDIAVSISGNVKRPESASLVRDLSNSSSAQIRKAAVVALWRYARVPGEQDATFKALAAALQDQDQSVRYAAVSNLAMLSGQFQRHPTLMEYRRNESQHLAYWRGWVATSPRLGPPMLHMNGGAGILIPMAR